MELHIRVKGKREPIIYTGDRIDVLDFNMNEVDYKQIRYFRKGISKSELIDSKLIVNIKKIK